LQDLIQTQNDREEEASQLEHVQGDIVTKQSTLQQAPVTNQKKAEAALARFVLGYVSTHTASFVFQALAGEANASEDVIYN
jgi:hypothetical protein